MPWSDSHSYVYVAIPKTGSTSTVATLKYMHEQHGGELLLQNEKVDATFRHRNNLDKTDQDANQEYLRHAPGNQ